MTTLYERLGGEAAIRAVVERMYTKIFPDPQLSDFFRKTDKEAQKQAQFEFITQVTGGPQIYHGKDMKAAHAGRGITSAEFDLVVKYVVESM